MRNLLNNPVVRKIITAVIILLFIAVVAMPFIGEKTDPAEAAALYDFSELYAGGGTFISLDNDYVFFDYTNGVMVEVITRNDEKGYTYILITTTDDGEIHGVMSDGSVTGAYYKIMEVDGVNRLAFFDEEGNQSKQKMLKQKDLSKSLSLLLDSGFLRDHPDPAGLTGTAAETP